MAIKIKLKGTAGRQNTPDWYRHDTEELAGVTNLPTNKELGLDNVLVFDPSDAQMENGMVCAVILKTLVGDIRGTIYQSKNAPGTLYLRPPQSREENEETGEVKYHDEVKLPSKLIAQVLRFMETQVDMVDDTPAEDKEISDIQVGVDSSPFKETSVPAGNVDQHAEDGENPFAD
jgi:hypothetical protein